MSLWLQAVLEAIEYGDYKRLRQDILPMAPIPIPDCLLRELEFGERRCRDGEKNILFPIRFLWLLEANEQRLWGYLPLARSHYHPEKLLELWARASADPQYRQEREAEGFRFDLAEKAMELTAGWVYIGDRLIDDFLDVEAAARFELMFPDPSSGELRPAFPNLPHRVRKESISS